MPPLPLIFRIHIISPLSLILPFKLLIVASSPDLNRHCHYRHRPSLSPFSSSSRLIWPKNPLILDPNIDVLLPERHSLLLSPLEPPNMP